PHDENSRPSNSPSGEEVPLLAANGRKVPHKVVCASIMMLVILALLISTVTFAALYYQLLAKDSARLPKWPKPSISPLGKYSRAAVAADNEYCSEIGRNVLLHGGNAVDAAVAALFCIGVMDSHSAGLGGGHFMTIYNATTQQCTVMMKGSRSKLPREDMFRDRME
ncbi:hypothetical protein OSTOST_23891, partial [Ostertagia ostertagi]